MRNFRSAAVVPVVGAALVLASGARTRGVGAAGVLGLALAHIVLFDTLAAISAVPIEAFDPRQIKHVVYYHNIQKMQDPVTPAPPAAARLDSRRSARLARAGATRAGSRRGFR